METDKEDRAESGSLRWDFLKKSVGPLKHVHAVPEECYTYILTSINSSVVKWKDDTSAGNILKIWKITRDGEESSSNSVPVER